MRTVLTCDDFVRTGACRTGVAQFVWWHDLDGETAVPLERLEKLRLSPEEADALDRAAERDGFGDYGYGYGDGVGDGDCDEHGDGGDGLGYGAYGDGWRSVGSGYGVEADDENNGDGGVGRGGGSVFSVDGVCELGDHSGDGECYGGRFL